MYLEHWVIIFIFLFGLG